MKRLRYSLLLPLIHLLLSTLLIYPRQQQVWPHLKSVPPIDETEPTRSDQEGFWPNPCYEYRPSVADRFAIGIELPAGLPLGLDGSFRACNHGLMAPLFRKLRMGAKTGTIFLDFILTCIIVAQWWLVGWRIDSLHKGAKSASLWLVPAVIISGAGCVMVPAGFGVSGLFELVAFFASAIAFFGWIFLLLAALVIVSKGILQRSTT